MTATISGDGTSTLINLTTSGNTVLGDASTDTLNVGNGGLVKDASGNVGIGTISPSNSAKLDVAGSIISTAATISTFNANNSGFDFIAASKIGRFFATSTDTTGGVMTFTTGQNGSYTERMRIDSSGNLLVGTTSSTARITALGASTTSANYALYAGNSSGQDLFYARCDGLINTGSRTLSPYNNTTGAAANMYVGATGDIARSTSSLKYKTNVQDATHGLTELLTLRPVTYEGKAESDAGKTFGGLIAEEVHEAGLTEFVQYAEDGSPDALAYGNMVSLCIKAIQEQQAIITQLQADVEALKAQP